MRLFKEKLSLLVVIFKCTLHASTFTENGKVRSNSYPKSEQVKTRYRQQEAKRRKAANIHSLTPIQSHFGEQKELPMFCKQGKQIPKRKYNSNANF